MSLKIVIPGGPLGMVPVPAGTTFEGGDVTGQIRVAPGSVGAPGYSFSGDANFNSSGLYATEYTLQVVVNGTVVVVYTNSGVNFNQPLNVNAGNTYDIGTAGFSWRNLYLQGTVLSMPAMPTADPHVAGVVWSNLGILTLSAG